MIKDHRPAHGVKEAKEVVSSPTLGERFWSKVQKTDGCWLWTSTKNFYGYGRFTIKGKPYGAHRLAYAELRESVPDDKVMDHLCKNPACVNPSHLEVVTQRENLLRGNTINAMHAAKTHCKNGHPLIGDNLVVNPSTKAEKRRRCRICLNLGSQRNYWKTKALKDGSGCDGK